MGRLFERIRRFFTPKHEEPKEETIIVQARDVDFADEAIDNVVDSASWTGMGWEAMEEAGVEIIPAEPAPAPVKKTKKPAKPRARKKKA